MFNKKHFLTLIIVLSVFAVAFAEQELIIKSVERQIALNGPYPVEQTYVDFKSRDNVNVFKHVVPISLQERIRFIVFSKNKDGRDPLPFTRQQYLFNGEKYALFKVELDRAYFSEQEGQIYIITTFLNRYVNFPAEIAMNEDQKFEFEDNKYFLSFYPVKAQTSTYKFDKILNYDKDGESKGVGTVVFKKQDADHFTQEKHVIHGVNNKPQVYFTSVQRTIQVSHWGNIAITEFYNLKNYGPSLKGEFSRISFGSQGYQDPASAKNAFRGIQAQLPYEVWGLYYRDEVGNISTSRAYRDDYSNKVKLALVPRFSLLGQWKSNWEVGYNLPTQKFLYNEGHNFQLDNIALEFTLDKIIAENYNFKVILPEGASNVKVRIGDQEITPSRIQKSFGYLDFFGRPTFVFQNYKGQLKKKNITVDYELDTLSTLYKPIVLFAFIFTCLAILIVVKRLRLEAFKEEKSE